MLELPQNHPPLQVCGKIVFYKTSPWCQKGWGLQKEQVKSRGKRGQAVGVESKCKGPAVRQFGALLFVVQSLSHVPLFVTP